MDNNQHETLVIKRRGEDGNRIISIRIKERTLLMVDELSNEAGYSRNELINLFIEYGLKHCKLI